MNENYTDDVVESASEISKNFKQFEIIDIKGTNDKTIRKFEIKKILPRGRMMVKVYKKKEGL